MNPKRKWKNPSINKNNRQRAIRNLRKIVAQEPMKYADGSMTDRNLDAELLLIALETEGDFEEQRRRIKAFVEKYTHRPTWGELIFEMLFPTIASERYIRP